MSAVTHFALLSSEGKPRYRITPMRFVHHNGVSKFRPRRTDITSSKMDEFAEYLAEGLTITQAAHRMGKDYCYGNAMLQRIRARLGPQAV